MTRSALSEGIRSTFLDRLSRDILASAHGSRVEAALGTSIPCGFVPAPRTRPSAFRTSIEWDGQDSDDDVLCAILGSAGQAAADVAQHVVRALASLRYGESVAVGITETYATRETSDVARMTGVESCVFTVHVTRIVKDPSP